MPRLQRTLADCVPLDTPENRPIIQDESGFTLEPPEGIVAAAAAHLEELDEHFPRFDREHVRASGALAAAANDPVAGIRALFEGRTDCTINTETLEEY